MCCIYASDMGGVVVGGSPTGYGEDSWGKAVLLDQPL
jgi:hypothetical protein